MPCKATKPVPPRAASDRMQTVSQKVIIIDLIMLALAVSDTELLSAIFMSFLTFPVVPIPFCYLKPSRSLFVESTCCFDVCHCVFYHRRIPQQDSHLHLTRSYVLA